MWTRFSCELQYISELRCTPRQWIIWWSVRRGSDGTLFYVCIFDISTIFAMKNYILQMMNSSRNDETPRETPAFRDKWQILMLEKRKRKSEKEWERNKIINLWKLHFARRIHAIEFEEDQTKKRREMANSSNEGNSRLAVLFARI